jgi:uncharacterized protein YcfJ
MRTMIFSAAAATLVLAAPAFAQAQSYGNRYTPVTQECQQSVNNNRLAGGLIGAVAGAVVGKQVAGRNARTEGQVLGAVVGAVAGSEIGKRRLACDDGAYNNAPQRQGAYHQNSYGYNNSYNNSGYTNGGYNNGYRHHHDDRAYQASYTPPVATRQECGWGEAALRRPDGLYERQQVWMCRDNRGAWQVAQ